MAAGRSAGRSLLPFLGGTLGVAAGVGFVVAAWWSFRRPTTPIVAVEAFGPLAARHPAIAPVAPSPAHAAEPVARPLKGRYDAGQIAHYRRGF